MSSEAEVKEGSNSNREVGVETPYGEFKVRLESLGDKHVLTIVTPDNKAYTYEIPKIPPEWIQTGLVVSIIAFIIWSVAWLWSSGVIGLSVPSRIIGIFFPGFGVIVDAVSKTLGEWFKKRKKK